MGELTRRQSGLGSGLRPETSEVETELWVDFEARHDQFRERKRLLSGCHTMHALLHYILRNMRLFNQILGLVYTEFM